MHQYGLLLLNGLSWSMTVFQAAAGLTLIFGILHILNFAHGGFIMLGAYLAFTLFGLVNSPSLWQFLTITFICAGSLGLLGVVVDKLVFVRLRGVSESYSLIATYALLLVCQGAIKLIWGNEVLNVSPPQDLRGVTEIAAISAPIFVLFIIFCGTATFVLLDILIRRTEIGKMIQAVAVDPWMAGLLGINVRLVLVGTVFLGVALAGLAGAVLSINQSLSPEMGGELIIQAFGVVVVGGMGSIRGAFVAAILLGILTTLGDRIYPEIPGLFFYFALIVILMVRPQGLLKGLR